MRLLFGMAALGLAVAVEGVSANASVPLPIIEQTSGVSSLAPLLRQITPAVVSIAIKGGVNSATNSAPGKGQRAQRVASTRDLAADRQMRATGSGVVIDPAEGIILTNAHVIAARIYEQTYP
jgi:S1-C subfamily serine protease